MKLREILQRKGSAVYSIEPSASLADVVAQLVEKNCGSLLVCEGDKMLGIITERDILRACDGIEDSLKDIPVEARMTTDVKTGDPDDEVSKAMGMMTESRIRHLPILEDGKLAGMISIGDVVKAQHQQLTVENHLLKTYIMS